MKKLIIVTVALVLGAVSFAAFRTTGAPKFDTAYQAVLLDNGQVYYGKVSGLGTSFPVITDVFYIQSQVNPETKAVTNILVRRGNEWHGPDRMVVNANHIVLVEPVSQNSKVSQLIAQAKN